MKKKLIYTSCYLSLDVNNVYCGCLILASDEWRGFPQYVCKSLQRLLLVQKRDLFQIKWFLSWRKGMIIESKCFRSGFFFKVLVYIARKLYCSMFLVLNVSIEDQFHCMRMSLKVSLSQISDSFIINQGLLKENTDLIWKPFTTHIEFRLIPCTIVFMYSVWRL